MFRVDFIWKGGSTKERFVDFLQNYIVYSSNIFRHLDNLDLNDDFAPPKDNFGVGIDQNTSIAIGNQTYIP